MAKKPISEKPVLRPHPLSPEGDVLILKIHAAGERGESYNLDDEDPLVVQELIDRGFIQKALN